MILKNNTQGYGYKYTELSQIVKALEEDGRTFYQYTATDPNTLKDYIYTVLVDKDGKESKPLRGSEIILATLAKSNPAQEMGASLTYARRYSLLMALGWATEDDDAKSLEGAKKIQPQKPMQAMKAGQDVNVEYITAVQTNKITTLIEELGYTRTEMLKHIANTGADDIVKLTKAQADTYIAFLEKQKQKKDIENAVLENAKEAQNGK